jgi:large subunit ribosomal protein L18
MESSVIKRNQKRLKRAVRIRKNVRGSAEKPRMSVLKSNQHIAVQIIDDEKGVTVVSLSTTMKEFRDKKVKKSKETAKQIGSKIAELAKAKQINAVVFDRGRYKYHGLIAELANAAREGGLQF